MAVSLSIFGVEQIQQILRTIDQGARQEVDKAITKATFLVEGEAKRRVPVDTGRLKSSIFSRFRTTAGTFSAGIGLGKPIAQGEVVTNVKYAPYIEYGTSKMKAQPYMMPALNASRPAIQSLVQNAVQAAINKEMKGLSKAASFGKKLFK